MGKLSELCKGKTFKEIVGILIVEVERLGELCEGGGEVEGWVDVESDVWEPTPPPAKPTPVPPAQVRVREERGFKTPPIYPIPPRDAAVQPKKLQHAQGKVLSCQECHQEVVRLKVDLYGETALDVRKDLEVLIGGWEEEVGISFVGGVLLQCPACGELGVKLR